MSGGGRSTAPGVSDRWTGTRAVDQSRVEALQRLVVDAEPAGGAGSVVLHEDVRRANQPMHDRDALGRFEIERDPALVAVDGHERAALAAGTRAAAALLFTARRPDLDDGRAHVC